ncbi:hypothetical protein F3Y22_tig00110831pilonHSYRG00784 [Hibiscus syriacus]|uniref:Uncharacterized protein n=1 Tax=Hibiscus syriacus TaxID=106335 RepID=A0A6A2ZMU0_HIBSY|nr:hypothetical protein F3Y22_tig00110831pilonHSYRG00784 [Hibiscus syriacus]
MVEVQVYGMSKSSQVCNISDMPGSSRSMAGTSSQMVFEIQIENPTYRSINSFVTMVESANEVGGTSAAVDYDDIFDGNKHDMTIDEYPTLYQLTLYMHEIDYDTMRALEFPEMSHLTSGHMIESSEYSSELSFGKQFRGKKEDTLTIKEYCIKGHVDCKVVESNHKTLTLQPNTVMQFPRTASIRVYPKHTAKGATLRECLGAREHTQESYSGPRGLPKGRLRYIRKVFRNLYI